jgi:hypothetical protein
LEGKKACQKAGGHFEGSSTVERTKGKATKAKPREQKHTINFTVFKYNWNITS